MTIDLVLKDLKAYIDGQVVECCIAIESGRIFKIGREFQMPKADTILSLDGLLVLPGLIDVHVHLRDEGKAYKEDFYSGTAAAAAGGITTVLDMPNNDPVTMSAATFRNRIEIAKSRILVNVGFYSEFPSEIQEIDNIIKEGCMAFKLFLGEQVGGLDIADDYKLTAAFKRIGNRVPVAVHAEDHEVLKAVRDELKQKGINGLEAFFKAHPVEAEEKAIKRIITIAERTGVQVHFCHLSSENGLKEVVKAKASNLPVSCEVTPHHILISTKELLNIGSLGLTLPPVRDIKHVNALWQGISKKFVDIIASDHAPHATWEKSANIIWNVKAGVPGLETTLSLLLNEVNKGKLALADVVRLMAENPAKIFSIKDRGSLREGNKADLVVVDLKREGYIDSQKFYSKAKYSPFDGWKVKGKPVKTFVGGLLVMDEGEIVGKTGCGEAIRRSVKY